MPISEEAATAPGPSTKQKRTFRGVRKRSWGRYVSEIRLPGQKTRIWLGSFGSAEMAARAYDSAAFFLKGSSAILNFPDLVDSLPRPLSSSRRDIQSAAAKAALELDPTRSSVKTDSMDWWDEDQFKLGVGEDSVFTIQPAVGELTWNEVFNFNDDILFMPSTL